MKAIFPVLISCNLATQALAQGWQYESETNLFTGDLDAWAAVPASSDTLGPDVYVDRPMILYVACQEGDLHIYIDTRVYIGGRTANIRYRFDEGKITTERWETSNDGSAVLLPRAYNDFEDALQNGMNLVFEVTNYRGDVYRTEFDNLNQSREVVERVKKDCN